MTQDYKDTLLRFLTGNLNEETGSNEPQFSEAYTFSVAIKQFLIDNIGSASGIHIVDLLQGYQTNYSILYGWSDYVNNGFMVILDENLSPIQYIDSYTSGTKFGLFQKLNVAEDGYIYGVDIINSTPRFIMLNNITLKTPSQQSFSVKLRQSYNLPSPINTALTYFSVSKAVGQAKYLIGGTTVENSGTKTMITELTINVGSTNDWVDYIYTESNEFFYGYSVWASWTEETLTSLKVNGYTTNSADTTQRYYNEYYLNNGSLSKRAIAFPESYTYGENVKTIIVNDTTAYMMVLVLAGGSTQTGYNPLYIYKVNYSNNTLTQIENINYGNETDISNIDYLSFKVVNNIPMFLCGFQYWQGINDILRYYAGMIIDTDVYYSYTESSSENIFDKVLFSVINNYNLYELCILGINVSRMFQIVYNSANYNGIAYENTNSLIPSNCILYDDNDRIAFARNIYNKSVYNNTTLSVLQIPNTMINDIEISQQDLLGQTNKILTSNIETFTKNIYETLYLNFYNTLLIQNRNTQDYINNLVASGRLSMSVSTAADYTSAKATKYKVVYIDFTSDTYETTPTILNGVATYNIQLILPYTNYPYELQIISEDEATIYQTIDISNLTPGKIYNITQECYID